MSRATIQARRQTTRAIAKLQVRDIERVVGRSGLLASRMWRVAADMARSNKRWLASGPRVKDPDEELLEKATDELANVMAYSYLLRLKVGNKRRSMAKSLKLASVFEDATRIADLFDLDLGNIKRRFYPTSSKAVKKSVADIRTVMNDALADVTKLNLPTEQGVAQMLEAIRRHGLQPRSTGYIETLVRTHSAIAYGVAHRISFEGDLDVWGFEYLTVGDDRVREEHEVLDGIKRKKDDEFWDQFWPPNGWNCRCQAVAIYDDEVTQTKVPSGASPDPGFETDFTELLL